MIEKTTQEKLQDEIARLKAINAELLAALEEVRMSGSNINLPAIEAAIANAQPKVDTSMNSPQDTTLRTSRGY